MVLCWGNVRLAAGTFASTGFWFIVEDRLEMTRGRVRRKLLKTVDIIQRTKEKQIALYSDTPEMLTFSIHALSSLIDAFVDNGIPNLQNA